MRNSPKKRAYFKRWYLANKESVKKKADLWAKNNPERARENKRRSAAKNKKARAVYMANKRAANVSFRILGNLRSRLNSALRRKKVVKSARTLELLGCDLATLRAHLESQFQPGMTWENIGEWQTDHRRPCRVFDFRDPKQQQECFHFTSLTCNHKNGLEWQACVLQPSVQRRHRTFPEKSDRGRFGGLPTPGSYRYEMVSRYCFAECF